MSIERKEQNASNTGYPDTAYNVVAVEALGYKGSSTGTGDSQNYEASVEYVYDFAGLPSSFTSETDAGLTTIPANSVIQSVDVQVLETISGGVNFTVGVSEPDGTVTDADGLVTASTITAVGDYAAGAGALIGDNLAADGQVTVGGDRTAGKIKVLVKYLKA